MAESLTVRRYRPEDGDRVWTVHELALRASPLEIVETAPADEDLADITPRDLKTGGDFLVGCRNTALVAIGGFGSREYGTAELRRVRVPTISDGDAVNAFSRRSKRASRSAGSIGSF